MTKRLESYFEYYWEHDKNYATKSENDKRFMSELPKEIRINVSISINNILDLQGFFV